MTQRSRHQRPIRLNEPGRIPEDAPSITLEHSTPAPWVRPELEVSPPPDSRSPSEVVHSEGYLLQCLKRHYGWVFADATTLIKGRRP